MQDCGFWSPSFTQAASFGGLVRSSKTCFSAHICTWLPENRTFNEHQQYIFLSCSLFLTSVRLLEHHRLPQFNTQPPVKQEHRRTDREVMLTAKINVCHKKLHNAFITFFISIQSRSPLMLHDTTYINFHPNRSWLPSLPIIRDSPGRTGSKKLPVKTPIYDLLRYLLGQLCARCRRVCGEDAIAAFSDVHCGTEGVFIGQRATAETLSINPPLRLSVFLWRCPQWTS